MHFRERSLTANLKEAVPRWFRLDYWWWLYPAYAGDTLTHQCTPEQTYTHTREKFRTYIQHIRQGVEIIKGAWRTRGCPDDGHVNQDGRQPGGLPSLQQSFVIGHFILMISMHAWNARLHCSGKGCILSLFLSHSLPSLSFSLALLILSLSLSLSLTHTLSLSFEFCVPSNVFS